MFQPRLDVLLSDDALLLNCPLTYMPPSAKTERKCWPGERISLDRHNGCKYATSQPIDINWSLISFLGSITYLVC